MNSIQLSFMHLSVMILFFHERQKEVLGPLVSTQGKLMVIYTAKLKKRTKKIINGVEMRMRVSK